MSRPFLRVYTALAHLADGRAIHAAVNPTTGTARKVEAFLMDGFTGDLYDRPLALDFRAKIRDEQKSSSLDAPTIQIAHDVTEAALLS